MKLRAGALLCTDPPSGAGRTETPTHCPPQNPASEHGCVLQRSGSELGGANLLIRLLGKLEVAFGNSTCGEFKSLGDRLQQILGCAGNRAYRVRAERHLANE